MKEPSPSRELPRSWAQVSVAIIELHTHDIGVWSHLNPIETQHHDLECKWLLIAFEGSV